jgi:hypothetical protein
MWDGFNTPASIQEAMGELMVNASEIECNGGPGITLVKGSGDLSLLILNLSLRRTFGILQRLTIQSYPLSELVYVARVVACLFHSLS